MSKDASAEPTLHLSLVLSYYLDFCVDLDQIFFALFVVFFDQKNDWPGHFPQYASSDSLQVDTFSIDGHRNIIRIIFYSYNNIISII